MTNTSSKCAADSEGLSVPEFRWRSTETHNVNKALSPAIRYGLVAPALLFCATVTTPFGQYDPTQELQRSGASSTPYDFGQKQHSVQGRLAGIRVSRKEARQIAISAAEAIRDRVAQSRVAEAQYLRDLYESADM